MNGWLLDVNVLCGCAWKTHADHGALFAWLLQQENWATCPIVELGFVRVSMTAAYAASFGDARQSLSTLRALKGHHFVIDNVHAGLLPVVTSYRETTDAHLVILAQNHGLKLATLDAALLGKSWAVGITENPILNQEGRVQTDLR